MGDEYSVAQEVEEEHGLLDSYIEDGVAESETGTVLCKLEGATVEEPSYTSQVCAYIFTIYERITPVQFSNMLLFLMPTV